MSEPVKPEQKQAVVVRGGWEGHVPVAASDMFVQPLLDNGYQVHVSDKLEIYDDRSVMDSADLVVQCWTMGEITPEQLAGLSRAVAAGTGLAGWHGGIVDSFRTSTGYLQMTGGQFVAHPGNFVDHEVVVSPERRDHDIVRGIEKVSLHTEQYWVLTDPLNDVLATTTLAPSADAPWHAPVTVPSVWTRRWGKGKVFVCTVGHNLADLEIPEIRTIIERGMLWASR